MTCALPLRSKAGLLEGDLRAGVTIKNTFIEFTDWELQNTTCGGLSRQFSEPTARACCRQVSDPAVPQHWSSHDEQVSRQTSRITTDEYPGTPDEFLTDDEVPSTGPPSPRSSYYVDSLGSQSPSPPVTPSWTELWLEHGSNSFLPEAPTYPTMPFGRFLPPEGMPSWGPCAGTNMVTLHGVPEDYSMSMLLAEFRNAGFQKGRDFMSVHMPMGANGMTNSGRCIVAFEKPSARNEFMVAFQGRPMRYSAASLPVSAAPSMPLEVLVATEAMQRERSQDVQEAGTTMRQCPGCNCQAETGFKFCTQCGVSLQGGWTQQRPR